MTQTLHVRHLTCRRRPAAAVKTAELEAIDGNRTVEESAVAGGGGRGRGITRGVGRDGTGRGTFDVDRTVSEVSISRQTEAAR